MYVKLGAGVTLTSYTAKISARDTNGVGGSWDLGVLRNWQGDITVIWEAGVSGAGRGTELT